MHLRRKSNTHSFCICYLKAMEGQVRLSTLLGIIINKTNDLILNLTPENVTQHSRSLYQQFIFSDILMALKDPRFKSFEIINTIDFLFL